MSRFPGKVIALHENGSIRVRLEDGRELDGWPHRTKAIPNPRVTFCEAIIVHPVVQKSESNTPRTNAASVDGWQTDDDSRYVPWFVAESLERELAIAVDALKTIAESNYSISATEPTAFANVIRRKDGITSDRNFEPHGSGSGPQNGEIKHEKRHTEYCGRR